MRWFMFSEVRGMIRCSNPPLLALLTFVALGNSVVAGVTQQVSSYSHPVFKATAILASSCSPHLNT